MIQSDLNNITVWADQNHIKLNPKMCKELRVNVQCESPVLLQLSIDDIPIEVVKSYKLLGLQIENNLKCANMLMKSL